MKQQDNPMPTEREQKLVDVMFSCVMMLAHPPTRGRDDQPLENWPPKSAEETAEWCRRQLELCGFPCTARGASWAVLDR